MAHIPYPLSDGALAPRLRDWNTSLLLASSAMAEEESLLPRSSSAPASSWKNPRVPVRMLACEMAAVLPTVCILGSIDWQRHIEKADMGADFDDNFTFFDESIWQSTTTMGCTYVEGIDYCQLTDSLDLDSTGVALTLGQDSRCTCKSSSSTAGHLATKDFYGWGKLDFDTALLEAANGTLACVGGYSQLDRDSTGFREGHAEATMCWFADGRSSLAWWTGSYLHSISTDVDAFARETGGRSFGISWSPNKIAFYVNGHVFFERRNASDCGHGPAYDPQYFIEGRYGLFENGLWRFDGGFDASNCSVFSRDKYDFIAQPMRLHALIRPYTQSAMQDSTLSGSFVLTRLRWRSSLDASSEDSSFRLWCRQWDGKTLLTTTCTRDIAAFFTMLREYTESLRVATLIVLSGVLTSSLRRRRPDNSTTTTTWTLVGVSGLLTRRITGSKRTLGWFALLFLGLRLAPLSAVWKSLSMRETTSTELAAHIAAAFVVMQVYHVVALAVATLPQRASTPDVNDADFVARIGAIVPCHKSAAEISRTIASLLASGLKQEHIVVVDNANSEAPPDDTDGVVRATAPGALYTYVPVGHKTLALWTGLELLPKVCTHVLHIDDDTVLPGASMVYDEAVFLADDTVSAVSYDIEIERSGLVERLVDFEFRLWSHWRYVRAVSSTAWFCHGIVGLWRRDRFRDALLEHPFMPFGEDGWLGCIVLGKNHRIHQEMRCAVSTFAPARLLPTSRTSRSQGYGAASVWKQRTRRWFVNAPRRLHLRLAQHLAYRDPSVAAAILFRVELARHVGLTAVVLLYPLFLARVVFDGTWLQFFQLKLLVLVLDLVVYAGLNYVVWPPSRRVDPTTVLCYPWYRLFLRLTQVVGHWRCVLWYIPRLPLRTATHTHVTQPGLTPPDVSIRALLRWTWSARYY